MPPPLPIRDLIRNWISGTLFLVSYYVTEHSDKSVNEIIGNIKNTVENNEYLFIAASLIIGISIYSIYRVVLDPIVDMVLLYLHEKRKMKPYGWLSCVFMQPLPSWHEHHMKIWEFRKDQKEAMDRFNAWADVNYLLLTASIAIGLGSIFSACFSDDACAFRISYPTLVICFILFALGCINSYRMIHAQNITVTEQECKGSKIFFRRKTNRRTSHA